MIKTILKNKIPIENSKINFVFSGRVAINILAKKFKKNATVLLPEYICNVVDKAFEEEYQIIRYSLNNKLEPSIQDLVNILKSHNVDILLLASLCGSGLFYEEIKNKKSKLHKLLMENNIEVIIDFAQDFYQINNLTLNNDKYHYIFSFNDKSFMGAMGAIIVTNSNLTNDIGTRKLSLTQKVVLSKDYLIKIIDCKLPNLLMSYRYIRGVKYMKSASCDLYEFSHCDNFPYSFVNYQISSIQLFFALIGISRLKKYKKIKQQFLNNNKSIIADNRFIETASFVVVNKVIAYRKQKKPYALYNNKFDSLHPNIRIVHNKGFCDK